MDPVPLLAVVVVFLAFVVISRRIEGTALTGPLMFAALGWLLGDGGLGVVPIALSNETLPLVLMFAVLASAASEPASGGDWIAFGLLQITLGPVAGAAVGHAGARLVDGAYRRGWMKESAEGIAAIGLALGAYALAELVHGNGFIAAFFAGLAMGNTLGRRCHYLQEFVETEGMLLVLAVFLAFGAAMLPVGLDGMTVTDTVYGLLALTVVRMLPVAVSLIGKGLERDTILFLGWFGPRGLASLLFVLIVLEQSAIAHESRVFTITVVTVGLSILLHGVTAGPGATRYAARIARLERCPEKHPAAPEPFAGSPDG